MTPDQKRSDSLGSCWVGGGRILGATVRGWRSIRRVWGASFWGLVSGVSFEMGRWAVRAWDQERNIISLSSFLISWPKHLYPAHLVFSSCRPSLDHNGTLRPQPYSVSSLASLPRCSEESS